MNTSKMAGESHLMEQAKKQWEKFDTEGHKIINDLLTTEAERIEWPKNTESKFTRKRGIKMTKVAYDTKTKNTPISTRQYKWENQSG